MTREELVGRVSTFIRESMAGRPHEPFDALARAIHGWQAEHDPVVASLVDRPVRRWSDIPSVPVDLFKQLPVGTVRRDEPTVVFRTSGTTVGKRGEHRMRDTGLYDQGAQAWARRCVRGMPRAVVGLLEDPGRTPDSSLSHMVAGFGDATWHMVDGELQVETLRARLDALDGPTFVATTAFALVAWLQTSPAPLPPRSVLMVTGGFKGRVHGVNREDLFQEVRVRLAPSRLVTEYGMTELSSQLWSVPGLPYLPPPWLKVWAVDPATGDPVPPDAPGQLRFYDLCNVDSTLAIETMDEGAVDAWGGITLHGRLAGAPARGCSLTVEEAWAR